MLGCKISLTIFSTVSGRICWNLSKKWQCRKKRIVDSTSRLQENNGFKQFWKLCLNLCSLRWLSPSLNLVRNLIPNGLKTLKIEFWTGLPILSKEFRKHMQDLAFFKLGSSLFHSTIVYGKKDYLNIFDRSLITFRNEFI